MGLIRRLASQLRPMRLVRLSGRSWGALLNAHEVPGDIGSEEMSASRVLDAVIILHRPEYHEWLTRDCQVGTCDHENESGCEVAAMKVYLCTECAAHSGDLNAIYPCPTVQLIANDLGVEIET